mmetsp:Transcript_4557/g.8388  ORF Transcript_4557/g.8388 Transcript_4557/m.8388 type:complete len:85 (+) Transcript_4557:307-561(+)
MAVTSRNGCIVPKVSSRRARCDGELSPPDLILLPKCYSISIDSGYRSYVHLCHQSIVSIPSLRIRMRAHLTVSNISFKLVRFHR